MEWDRLQRAASLELERCQRRLPGPLRERLKACRLVLEEFCEWDRQCLGVFEGLPVYQQAAEPSQLPQIRLFLGALWEFSGRNPREFRVQVSITLLHELGHFLGLDEGQVRCLGLE